MTIPATTAQVPIRVGPPNVCLIPISSPPGGLDLNTVTGVSIDVRKPDGTAAIWTATLQQVTTTSATAAHAFDPADLDVAGVWKLAPLLAVAGGVVPCYSRPLIVTVSP